MATILEELTKYREILSEDRTAITLPKKEMGREAYRRYLHNNSTVGNVDRLLELLNEYAEKINQLSMLGKSTEKYQIMMDKIEETIGSYPDGQQRLDDFWREYNDSFDDVYESTVVNEEPTRSPTIRASINMLNRLDDLRDKIEQAKADNDWNRVAALKIQFSKMYKKQGQMMKRQFSEGKTCKFCHKPVELSPSAAARAKKFGGSPADYIAIFPNHSECELANRKKSASDLMAQKKKENADSQVILKRTMKEYVNPSDLPEIEAESKCIELGKHNAMEELSEIVARIPAHQEIPYAEFGKTLVGLHRTYGKRSATKVVEFTRGWNFILQKVNEMLPKSRTRHLTKDELQSVITFVGEKELNWN